MRSLWWYWFVGCFVIGLPLGGWMVKCPNQGPSAVETLAAVAAWPALLIAAVSYGVQDHPKFECKGPK